MSQLVFGSEEASRQLEIDKGRRLAISVYPTGYNFDDSPLDDAQDRYCTVCGGYMDFIDCWQCGGDGEFDLYDEDPINFSKGEEFERCDVCRGEGGYWECASLPHKEGVSA